MTNEQTKELLQIIQENPELPLVFMVDGSEIADICEWRCIYIDEYSTKVETIWKWEDEYLTDEIEVEELVEEYLSGMEEYEDLKGEEFEKAVKKYIKENVEKSKAIVVYL